jgi:hypothetical protein
MVFENAIEHLSNEALTSLVEDALKRANDAVEGDSSNKYVADQLAIAELCERELLKRKLTANK